MADVVLLAKCNHLANARDSQPRFDGARFVIKSRVQDAAIVARLMARDVGLFFEDDDFDSGKFFAQFDGGAQTDYPSADDDDAFLSQSVYRVGRIGECVKDGRTAEDGT